MASGWSVDETRALLGIWGAADVQSKLDGVARNRLVYQKIASALADLGYERTWEQCRTKIKNLTQKYRKVKDGNKVSGNHRTTCPWYDEIDAILGTRAASSPPVVLDSGLPNQSSTTHTGQSPSGSQANSRAHIEQSTTSSQDHSMNTDDECEGESNEAIQGTTAGTLSTPQSAALDTTPTMPETTEEDGESSTMTTTRRTAITARKKGLKRKRTDNTSDLARIFEEYDKREDKRMTFLLELEARTREREAEMEARAREREDRREERLMTMLGGLINNMGGTGMYHPPYLPTSYPPFPPPSTSQSLHNPESPQYSYNFSDSQDPPSP